MQKQIIMTGDGSHTISVGENITYHSIHGALQESRHVFIGAGLSPLPSSTHKIYLLEIGLGTGLNALLSAIEATAHRQCIHYTALEPFPLTAAEAGRLNYASLLPQNEEHNYFYEIHNSEWGKNITITPFFTLHKTQQSLLTFNSDTLFHLIYFDAFAPAVQPGLWASEIFRHLYNIMHPGGILVTYCSKGDVRRAMHAAGFTVEKLTGAKGKREMLRARK